MNKERKSTVRFLIIVIGMIFLAAAIFGILYLKWVSDEADKEWASRSGGSVKAFYIRGESVDTDKGTITHRFNENNTLRVGITNTSSDNWEPTISLRGTKLLEKVENEYFDEVYLADYYVFTNKAFSSENPHTIVNYDALKLTIDGKETDNLIIPPDGKEHTLDIKYNYLKANGIDSDTSVKIDKYRFGII